LHLGFKLNKPQVYFAVRILPLNTQYAPPLTNLSIHYH